MNTEDERRDEAEALQVMLNNNLFNNHYNEIFKEKQYYQMASILQKITKIINFHSPTNKKTHTLADMAIWHMVT